jgi:long-chain acyl-CoA synthetase
MQYTSNLPQIDVLLGKPVSNTAPEETNAMHISKFLIVGALVADIASALKLPYSVELNMSHHPSNEGSIRRLRTIADGNLTSTILGHPHILTAYDLVQNAVEQWRDKECLGSRKIVKKHEEEKQITKVVNGVEQKTSKKWTYTELSPYEYRTYRDLGVETKSVGAGLRKLGLNPGDHVGIYGDTSYYFLLSILM